MQQPAIDFDNDKIPKSSACVEKSCNKPMKNPIKTPKNRPYKIDNTVTYNNAISG